MPAKTVFNPLYKAKEFCTVLSDMGDDESTDDFFGMAVLCTVAVLAETRFFSGQAQYCHSGLVNFQASWIAGYEANPNFWSDNFCYCRNNLLAVAAKK